MIEKLIAENKRRFLLQLFAEGDGDGAGDGNGSGSEGGDGGGTMVACGTPEEIAEVPESYTGYYVKKYLKK